MIGQEKDQKIRAIKVEGKLKVTLDTKREHKEAKKGQVLLKENNTV